MLTRLKVSGFKNLVDVDVRFGPFNCVVGPSGAGKSNLFDAIHFLSALADRPLTEAALSVRGVGEENDLFHFVGDQRATEMAFEAEMIIPAEGRDALGQRAEAGITLLRYALTLARRKDPAHPAGLLELVREDLIHINKGDAHRHLRFPHKVNTWRNSAVVGRRDNKAPYISTEQAGTDRVIRLHQDGSSGHTFQRLAADLPRTVLSACTTAETATALLARQEMRSWQVFRLDPAALRRSDSFDAPAHLAPNGAHLASLLHHLGHSNEQFFARLAGRLADLVGNVEKIRVEPDERRGQLTLQVMDHDGTSYMAGLFPDATLRLLALAALEFDPNAPNLICLEEPEDGIHPERIASLLSLLQDIATDAEGPLSAENPLRQVIVTSHSPILVAQTPDDCLLLADLKDTALGERTFRRAWFGYLAETWREAASREDSEPVQVASRPAAWSSPAPVLADKPAGQTEKRPAETRHAHADDSQQMLPGFG